MKPKILKHRGVMVDLARERSFHLPWMLELVRDLARQGTNELHLYLENRFAFPSLPKAYPKGSMKPADVRVLEKEAHQCGVRLVPHLNLLGHNENLLHRPRYRHLRAEADPARAYQINPLHPGTRPLLKKIIRDVCAAFSSPLIHVGCDEAVEWKALERQAGKKAWQIYGDHVRWIHGQLKRHGRRTAIWADTPLHYPQLLKSLPRDIVLFDWCYAGHRKQSLQLFLKEGFEVVAATSPVGCFAFLPHPPSVARQLAFLDDAFALGASGHLATLWELMRGYLFSIEYAFSLPVQWKAAGHAGSPNALWKRFYGKAGLAWWKAAQQLSKLQLDDGLLLKKPAAEWVFNLDASQSLTFSTHPFAFEVKYAGLIDRAKLKKRLRHTEAWELHARRLPRWSPKGPLKSLSADLRLTARRMSLAAQNLLEWRELLAERRAGRIKAMVERRRRDYLILAREYEQRTRGEGYGVATSLRIRAAINSLEAWKKSVLRAFRNRDETVVLTAEGLESYSLQRTIHPADLA